MPRERTVLIANPSADVYGADLQMLESASALAQRGWRVVVAMPAHGPLESRLRERGVETLVLRYPVLRRADVSGHRIAMLGVSLSAAAARMTGALRQVSPDVLYVNTITLPWWLALARRHRVPSVCHVHEAEAADSRLIRRCLTAPLHLADRLILNSLATESVICGTEPGLSARSRLIRNGVRGPSYTPLPAQPLTTFRLVVVGRLSPRKAPDVALEALAIVRRSGREAELELCGTPGLGHESYVDQLVARARRADLSGHVHFTGYVAPVWPAFERADAVVAPSLGESFGNAVVEGQLARRPVVATAVQGHLETVRDGVTGFLVPVRDPHAMARRVIDLMDDPALARQVALLGLRNAQADFGLERYGEDVARLLSEMTRRTARDAPRSSVTRGGSASRR